MVRWSEQLASVEHRRSSDDGPLPVRPVLNRVRRPPPEPRAPWRLAGARTVTNYMYAHYMPIASRALMQTHAATRLAPSPATLAETSRVAV